MSTAKVTPISLTANTYANSLQDDQYICFNPKQLSTGLFTGQKSSEELKQTGYFPLEFQQIIDLGYEYKNDLKGKNLEHTIAILERKEILKKKHMKEQSFLKRVVNVIYEIARNLWFYHKWMTNLELSADLISGLKQQLKDAESSEEISEEDEKTIESCAELKKTLAERELSLKIANEHLESYRTSFTANEKKYSSIKNDIEKKDKLISEKTSVIFDLELELSKSKDLHEIKIKEITKEYEKKIANLSAKHISLTTKLEREEELTELRENPAEVIKKLQSEIDDLKMQLAEAKTTRTTPVSAAPIIPKKSGEFKFTVGKKGGSTIGFTLPSSTSEITPSSSTPLTKFASVGALPVEKKTLTDRKKEYNDAAKKEKELDKIDASKASGIKKVGKTNKERLEHLHLSLKEKNPELCSPGQLRAIIEEAVKEFPEKKITSPALREKEFVKVIVKLCGVPTEDEAFSERFEVILGHLLKLASGESASTFMEWFPSSKYCSLDLTLICIEKIASREASANVKNPDIQTLIKKYNNYLINDRKNKIIDDKHRYDNPQLLSGLRCLIDDPGNTYQASEQLIENAIAMPEFTHEACYQLLKYCNEARFVKIVPEVQGSMLKFINALPPEDPKGIETKEEYELRCQDKKDKFEKLCGTYGEDDSIIKFLKTNKK